MNFPFPAVARTTPAPSPGPVRPVATGGAVTPRDRAENGRRRQRCGCSSCRYRAASKQPCTLSSVAGLRPMPGWRVEVTMTEGEPVGVASGRSVPAQVYPPERPFHTRAIPQPTGAREAEHGGSSGH